VPEFSSHRPGTFSWPELATTDQKGGVAFYRKLFDWDVNEQPIGPNEMYSLFQLRGKEVAAAYTMRADERQLGIPPHWNAYVSVTNVDEATERAKSLGATVLAPPFDVMDAGRMSVIQDPQGAVVQLWQAKRNPGARILNEPGALCWTELVTTDMNAAEKFYTQLFGWSAKSGTDGGSTPPYTEFSVGGSAGAGMMAVQPEWGKVPPHWTPYFMVADCDAAAQKAVAAGGKVAMPPTDISKVGRFAMIQDPQGAMFAIFTPAPRQ
jgi:uncharacterized protein